ncbi:MAG TPA: XrtA system polysaccharide chain length determinant [Acetobacteraceae bacterium]|nr:XrtA system polysaccharide chain length determinant [Acetobacteraceae bacterium]HTB44528.1 XrtA system polysaccharide chain length determinant [Acetobacteraceae bacterium]
MDSLRILVQQYLRAAWRRRWMGVIVAWLVCGVGWVGVYLIPNQFESSARLFVDADAILTPLLRGLAAETAPTTELEILQRTLLSRPNMEKLISKTDLDLTINSPADRERLISRLADTIRVVPQTKNLFTITYRDKNPKMAHDVVQTLLTIFVENATGSNRSDMDNARHFLEHQIASYEQQLRAAEKRRADFRARYIDILPNAATPGVPALEAARNAVTTLDGKLQDMIMERDALKDEVDKTPPMLVAETAQQQMALGLAPAAKTRLEEAEDQLRMLLLKDTDAHPDVIAQRKLIESLKTAPPDTPKAPVPAAPAAAGAAAGHAAAATGGSSRSVPNPVYDQLKVKLIDADSQVAALQRQRDSAVAYREKLEKIQQEQPGLIAEYENTDRDYNVLRSSYEQLLGRLQSANIAQAADTQADKVKLQIVDPPETPRLPVAPNRMLLVTGVLLAGCAAGLGVTVLFGQVDNSFSTADDLRTLGLPVLGGISVLGLASLRQRLTIVARFGVAVVLLVGVYGGLLVHILRSSSLI